MKTRRFKNYSTVECQICKAQGPHINREDCEHSISLDSKPIWWWNKRMPIKHLNKLNRIELPLWYKQLTNKQDSYLDTELCSSRLSTIIKQLEQVRSMKDCAVSEIGKQRLTKIINTLHTVFSQQLDCDRLLDKAHRDKLSPPEVIIEAKNEAYEEALDKVKWELYYEFNKPLSTAIINRIDELKNRLVGEDK
jgi:hypothetical protein